MVDKDEIGSNLRKEMADRSKVNIIPFDATGYTGGGMDADGTYPANMSACACSNRPVQHPTKKGYILCTGCGRETDITPPEEGGPKHKKGKKKIFAISKQPAKSSQQQDIEESSAILGGQVTSKSDEWEWNP
jgi:hypothetical protein